MNKNILLPDFQKLLRENRIRYNSNLTDYGNQISIRVGQLSVATCYFKRGLLDRIVPERHDKKYNSIFEGITTAIQNFDDQTSDIFENLDEPTKESNVMSNKLNLFIASQRPDFKIIGVNFNSGDKVYHYKTLLDVQEGDQILVPVQNKSPSVVRVVSVKDALSCNLSYELKWVIQKIDFTDFDACVEMESKCQTLINRAEVRKQNTELLEEFQTYLGEEGIKELQSLTFKGE